MTTIDAVLLWAFVSIGIMVAHHRMRRRQRDRHLVILDLTGRRW